MQIVCNGMISTSRQEEANHVDAVVLRGEVKRGYSLPVRRTAKRGSPIHIRAVIE